MVMVNTETTLFPPFYLKRLVFHSPPINLNSNIYIRSFLSNTCLELFEDQFVIVIRSITCRVQFNS